MKIDVAPETLKKALARVSESFSGACIVAYRYTKECPEGEAICVGYGDNTILDMLIATQGQEAEARLAKDGIHLLPDGPEGAEGESPLP